MSVHKDNQAKKSGRIAWIVMYKGKMYRGYKTKKEAEQFESKLRLGIVGERPTEDPFFYSVIDDFLKYYREDRKYATFNKCETAIRMHVKPNFKNKRISKITSADCNAFRSKIGKLELSTRTKNYILEKFKSIIYHARKYFGLKENPVEFLERFKQTHEDVRKKKEKSNRYWSPEDFELFIEAVKKQQRRSISIDDYALFFEILYWTGLRRGEAMALSYDDVSDDKRLQITKSLTTKTEQVGYEITTPKNFNSNRTVEIDDHLYHLINEHRNKNSKKKGFRNSWFICGGPCPITTSSIERVKNSAIKETGLKPIKIHDLRGSHISYLLSEGVISKTVAERVGHGDVQTTLNEYAKVTDQSIVDVLKILNKKHN